jgi:probable rRNA maturation factor
MSKRIVSVSNNCPRLRCKASDVRAMIRALDQDMPEPRAPEGELSFAIVGEEEIVAMHERFLNDPTVTDVITFPGSPEDGFAGEVCVCADYAQRQAPLFGQCVDEELTLYMVHGWLHLAGYDDIDEADRVKMREGEAKAMSLLRERGLIVHFCPAKSRKTSTSGR